MRRIKIKSSTVASGASMKAGSLADVPGDISSADASILVRMGRAEWQEPEKPAAPSLKPTTQTRKKSTKKPRSK